MKTHRRITRRKKTLAVAWNPWINLALQTGEMLAASAQVIGYAVLGNRRNDNALVVYF